jgi:hypothetical protein
MPLAAVSLSQAQLVCVSGQGIEYVLEGISTPIQSRMQIITGGILGGKTQPVGADLGSSSVSVS